MRRSYVQPANLPLDEVALSIIVQQKISVTWPGLRIDGVHRYDGFDSILVSAPAEGLSGVVIFCKQRFGTLAMAAPLACWDAVIN